MLPILIGIGIALAGSLALAVFRKPHRTVWLGVSGCTAAAFLVSIVCSAAGVLPFHPDTGAYFSDGQRAGDSGAEEKASDYLEIVRYLLDAGRTNDAQKLLREYGENYEYNNEYLSLVADVYAASGNPERANKLRASLGIPVKETESEPVVTATSNPVSGIPAVTAAGDPYSDPFLEDVEDAFDSSAKMEKNVSVAAKGYRAICELTDLIQRKKNINRTAMNEHYRSIRDWANTHYIFSGLPSLRRAKLAAELYLHDYSDIARSVMNDPSSDSLIVASQLVRNGSISNSSSDTFFSPEQREDAEKVYLHLEAERGQGSAYSSDEQEYLNKAAENLNDALSGKADFMQILSEKMEHEALNDPASAAKVYLELADIAYAYGDLAEASRFLEKCLKYAPQSSDTEFAAIVNKINDMVFRATDAEARKKLSEYVKRMEENRMPENLPPIDTTVLDSAAAADSSAVPSGLNNGSPENPQNAAENPSADSSVPQDGTGQTALPVSDRPFADNVTDSLNQMAASVNILSIDAGNFEKVSAVISADESLFSDAEGFRSHMQVVDAGVEIHDYNVEKVQYGNVNVILVCDDSGSMGGAPRNDLCKAVKSFVMNADDNVKIGMVPFASSVKTNHVSALGASKDELYRNADALCADGGTNIYDAVVYANSMFPKNDSELNIMILMSDGKDGAPSPDQLEALRNTCLDRSISIYSVGLGSGADANLLKMYSDYCNGAYFYVNASESIDSFYQFIFTLGKNRYRIDFDAFDTFQTDRTLEVIYDQSPAIRDEQTYTIFKNDLLGKEGTDCEVSIGNVVINGLKEKMIYPSERPQELTLLGNGFESDAKMSAELHGATTLSCTVEYTDEHTAKFIVPAGAPIGLYDVYVNYNGRRAVFYCGLVISSGDTNIIRFGEYIFTASNIETSGNTTTLSGVVQLNGWLGFTDSVKLTGNLASDQQIQMEFGKTYVVYSDPEAGGLAGYYAKNGYVVKLPAGGKVRLYNDRNIAGTSDEYPVDSAPVTNYSLIDVLTLSGRTAGLSIYPDRAVLNFDEFTTAFPFQGKVISTYAKEMFHYKLDHKTKLTYKKNSLDCSIELDVGNNRKKDELIPIKIGNADILANLGNLKFKLDTAKGEVNFSLTSNIAMLADGIGFEIGVKEWKLDKIMLMCDYDLPTTICGMPVTFSNFKLGVQDLSKMDLSKGWTELFKAELVGGCNVTLAKLSSYCPALKKYLGDISLLSLEDLTLGLRLNEFRIRAEAKAKALDLVEVGHAKLQLGMGLEYENPLFVLQGDPNGICGEVGTSLKIDEDNFLFDLGGSLNLALTDKVIGLWGHGQFRLRVGWWVFVADTSATGDGFLGWYQQNNGKMAFAVLASGVTPDGKNKDIQVVWGQDDKVVSHKF